MSLNYNYSKVENIDLVREEHLITDAIIWATMAIGMNKITADNADEFYRRIHLIELVRGAWLNEAGVPKYITLKNIHDRVGMYTNASTKTRAGFNKFALKCYWDD